jgi:hypothetical protein
VSTPTPTIAGTVRVGQTLTASSGTWDDGVTKGYQWSANGAPIPGATAASYVLVAGDLGKRITVTVTGVKAGYATVSRTSAQTVPVAKGTLPKPGRPTITGTVKAGKKLTAVAGAAPAGVTRTFQWYVGSKAVPGAIASTLKLKTAYRGQRISVKVIWSRVGYQTRKAKSTQTAPVV